MLVAPPGAGKTTRVPLVLLDEPWAAKTRKFCCWSHADLRGACRSRSAHGLNASAQQVLGEAVGLRVRFGSAFPKRTRIEVITEGVFTRMILDDPSLEGVAAVLFDEFHERSLDADLRAWRWRSVMCRLALREDLKDLW